MSWPVVTLNEICKTQYGYTASACDNNIGPKFLRITDIVPSSINWEDVPFCEIDEEKSANYKLSIGDIVIARTGNTTGYAKLIRDDVNAIFASYLVRLQLDENICDSGFVGRLIESNIYKKFVNSIKSGAAQGNANAKTLTLFKFRLPPVNTQKKIASILSAYDDLIENNRRRIQLLEESARLLYKEWFVHLRFPGHEHTKIIDGVPEGWKKEPLGEILTLQRGFDLPVKKRKEGTVPIYASSGINGYHNEAKANAIGIVTGRSGSLGKVMLVQENYWPLNTTLWVKKFKKVSPLFAFQLLSGMNLEQYNGGAAVPTLNRNNVHRVNMLRPNERLMEEYEQVALVTYKQIRKLEQYNQKLAQARDLLLPRLMNGEIEV